MMSGDEDDVLKLIRKLSSPNPETRDNAANVLVQIGEPAIPALISTFEDENERLFVRSKAAHILGEIGDVSTVQMLIGALKDKHPDVRKGSALALGKIGVNEEQLNILIQMLKMGKTWDERRGAACALGEIGDVSTVPDLVDALNAPDLRWTAAPALERIGFDKFSMKDKVLTLLLTNKKYDVAGMGKSAVPALIDILDYRNSGIRENVAELLGDIGVSEEQLRMIIKMLKDGKTRIERHSAALALVNIAEKHPDYDWKDAVPALIYSLKDKNFGAQYRVVKVLNEVIKKIAYGNDDSPSTMARMKDITLKVRKLDNKQMRRKLIENLVEVTQQIHDRLNTIDKKEFPVKRQEVKISAVKKAVRVCR